MNYYSTAIILNSDNVLGFIKMTKQAQQMECKVSHLIETYKDENDFLILPIAIQLSDNLNIQTFISQIILNIALSDWKKIDEEGFLTYSLIDWDDTADWTTMTNNLDSSFLVGMARHNDKIAQGNAGIELPEIEILELSEQVLAKFTEHGYQYVDDILQKLRLKQVGIDGRPIGESTMLIILDYDQIAYQELVEKLQKHGYL